MKSKIIIAALLSLFAILPAAAQNNITSKLIGKWEATDSQKVTGRLNFLDSINIFVNIPDHPMPPGTYTIDPTKTPMWFDITIKQGNKIAILKGLLKLINDNTLKWQIFQDGKRPDKFIKENSDNTIILKKKT